MNFIILILGVVLVINIMIVPKFQNQWCTSDFWKGCLEKIKIDYNKVLSDLNMQKKIWNFINLHQILIIETLLVMELIGKKKVIIQINVFVW
jgi:hypothetical protein